MEDRADNRQFWPQLERLAQPAREERGLSPHVVERIILDLCARAPLSTAEIGDLLQRPEAVARDAIRPLVESSQLNLVQQGSLQRYATAATLNRASPATTSSAPPISAAELQRALDQQAKTRAPARKQAENAATMLNDRTSPLIAMFLGAVIALLAPKYWWAYAVVSAAALSALHVATSSIQYLQYRRLASARSRLVSFLVLKFLVALAETSAVYGLVTVILRRID